MKKKTKYNLNKEEFLDYNKKIPESVFNSSANLEYFKKVYEAKKKNGGDYSKEEEYLRKNGIKLD
ncbi:hypothetical protein EFS28_09335 [Lactobacillus acidophilus]|uniref:hypothetical protein n=1 Tax=Lactobacillus acidophilus TaxID=1579 RepID=UPI0021A3DB6C|nr:hypothetical protein [Lactobacillus acidophilus]MCT3602087.1 hypothetical protein [Lactobacillus acidophilus]MCT3624400.1 hypothetical protein [Lactobacillus acidophilus]